MNPHHDAPEHSQERARDIYEKQAKERQIRKPADSVVENLPQQNTKARDAAGKARDAIDRAMQRKPGNADGVNQHTKELGTFDNVQDSKAPTGNAKDAALRRLRKAGLLLAAMEKNKG